MRFYSKRSDAPGLRCITRTPTMDIDLLRRGIADPDILVGLVGQCAAVGDPNDGVAFDAATISVVRDAIKNSEQPNRRSALLCPHD
jgi:hypothetical protein